MGGAGGGDSSICERVRRREQIDKKERDSGAEELRSRQK